MLNTVQGYEVDLIAQPYQCLPPKELSFNKEEAKALSTEVEKMLSKNAISLVQGQSPGFYSQLFIVPKKDGGQRPIINLKKLNSFVKPQHFKMESITMLKDTLKQGDYCISGLVCIVKRLRLLNYISKVFAVKRLR